MADFRRIYESYRGNPFNNAQWAVIKAKPAECMHVVAGPGTGKTTSMVGRIMKLVYHDQIRPSEILATTFTKKAAEELRSRLLSSGLELKDCLLQDPAVGTTEKAWIEGVDMNQVLTGTMDSICQNILRESKPPGSADPEPVDDYVASTLFFRDGLLFSKKSQDEDLGEYLLELNGGQKFGFDAARKAKLIEEIYQRVNNDCVNFPAFQTVGNSEEQQAKGIIGTVIERYKEKLQGIGGVDYVELEAEVLRRFEAGEPKTCEWRDRLKVVIVDEYQDTNLLQEKIYFEMARNCETITVVGDDDQSLYRFRGATVELFVNFPDRVQNEFGKSASQHFLKENYRSTQPIVDLANGYADLDAEYQTVRVAPTAGGTRGILCKSNITTVFPVLGLFRDTIEELSRDLSSLIHDVFRGKGRHIPGVGNLVCENNSGDVGDCCLLGSSHQESTPQRTRLPGHLREDLANLPSRIGVFNPRGSSLAEIDQVALLGGYLGCIIDPDLSILPDSAVGKYEETTKEVIERWISLATDHFNQLASADFQKYVQAWYERKPDRGGNWPKRVSILEFLNGIRHFLPYFRDDPEGLVYYEVFTRQFQSCQRISTYNGELLHNTGHPSWEKNAGNALIDLFLGPIASGTVGVNEELMDSFPRNRLSVLSIHQSKGLEFPMVIVDIGSDFKTNHHAQRRNRAPDKGESCHRLESMMRGYSQGVKVPTRSETDRAYDDLFRKFFVAYSRAEQVLLLVGLEKSRPDNCSIDNVAAGCDRNGARVWPSNVPITYL